MGQPQYPKKQISKSEIFQLVQNNKSVQNCITVNRNCVSRSLIQLSVLLKVKIDFRNISEAHLLLPLILHGTPKKTDIQTHWIDVPSAVEIVRSNVVAKREISIMENILEIVKHYKY